MLTMMYYNRKNRICQHLFGTFFKYISFSLSFSLIFFFSLLFSYAVSLIFQQFHINIVFLPLSLLFFVFHAFFFFSISHKNKHRTGYFPPCAVLTIPLFLFRPHIQHHPQQAHHQSQPRYHHTVRILQWNSVLYSQ